MTIKLGDRSFALQPSARAQKTNFRGAQQLLRQHVDFISESKELGFNARVTQTLCSAHDSWHDSQINVCGPQAALGEK